MIHLSFKHACSIHVFAYFCAMRNSVGIIIFSVCFLFSCQSKIDKELAQIAPFEKFFAPLVVFDSLPKNADSLLYQFAKSHPKHHKSEIYSYYATVILEKRKLGLKAAEVAEFYVDHYTVDKQRRMEQAMVAAHYYEVHQVLDKALKHYEILNKEYEGQEVGKQAEKMIFFIKKGITTPEQQLEYMLKQDSLKNIKP